MRLALDDDVLQDLVDGVADVDVAVRVRRAVVQDEARAARARGADRLVDLRALPFLAPSPARASRGRRASGTACRAGSAWSCSRSWIRRACSRSFVGRCGVSAARREILAGLRHVGCGSGRVSASRSAYFSSSRSLCRNSTVFADRRSLSSKSNRKTSSMRLAFAARPSAARRGSRRRARGAPRPCTRTAKMPDSGGLRRSGRLAVGKPSLRPSFSPCATRPEIAYGRPSSARRAIEIAARERFAHRGRRRALAVDRHRAHRLDAERLRVRAQHARCRPRGPCRSGNPRRPAPSARRAGARARRR